MFESKREPTPAVAQGMDVCDVSGEKVGAVQRVRRLDESADVVEVKTGPFGLGKRLYVPPEAVDGVTEAGLMLKHSKHEFHEMGLDVKPEGL